MIDETHDGFWVTGKLQIVPAQVQEKKTMYAPAVEESKARVAVLRLSGRFDAYEEPAVRAWLEENRKAGVSRIVINLEEVNFLDSMALAVLVKGMKDTRSAGGDLHLSGLQQPVRIIFELTRMDRVFPIFDSESAAAEAFEN